MEIYLQEIYLAYREKKNTLEQPVSTKVSENKIKRKFIQNQNKRNNYKGK